MSQIEQKKILEAFENIIKWSGDDSSRKDLINTPQRAVSAYGEIFSGYNLDLSKLKTIENCDQYKDLIILKNHEFFSICEHHLLPFIGKISIGYIPNKKILGIGNIRNIIDCYSKRLQIQERITDQIAQFLDQHLEPKGIAVIIEATHLCFSITKHNSAESRLLTTCFLGDCKDLSLQQNFLSLIKL